MKLSLLFKILLIIVSVTSLYYGDGGSGGISIVGASSSITRNHSEFIQQQFSLRGKPIDAQSFANDINNYDPQKGTNKIFSYIKLTSNVIASALTLFPATAGVGCTLRLGVSCLELITSVITGKKNKGDLGYTIANGVKGLIDQEVSSFNSKDLSAISKGLSDRINHFYLHKTDSNSIKFDIFLQSTLIDDDFIETKAKFQKAGYRLDSIVLFTLFANSHLLFLYDMVSSGTSRYNFTLSEVNYFKSALYSNIKDYKDYIDQVDIEGLAELEVKIKKNNIRYQDEWNERNDYYNFMKLYVYDISNYWEFLDPINYPNGMFIENAHVSLSKLFGAPYKGKNHLTAKEIDSYLLSNNVYQYQGKLKGIYYKNMVCGIELTNFYLVKYFGGRQYFFRENQERDTKYLGDEGKLAGLTKYINLSDSSSVDFVTQYLARDKSPKSFSKDFHWGLRINNVNIGDVSVYKTNTSISYPEKTITSVLPISYNKCSIDCNGKESSAYLVESAIIGFVNKDVIYDNIIFELTGTMVDAQKYLNYSSYSSNNNSGVIYSRDGYNKYKHSIFIHTNTKVTYKINYNSFDNSTGNFKFQIDFRSESSNSNLNIRLLISSPSSSSSSNSTPFEINKQINVSSEKGQIYEIGIINLYSNINNYIILEFDSPVYLGSLIFVSI